MNPKKSIEVLKGQIEKLEADLEKYRVNLGRSDKEIQEMKSWNIVILSRKDNKRDVIDLGFPNKQFVNKINRSEAISVGTENY